MNYIVTIILFLFSFQSAVAQEKTDGPFKDYYDSGELYTEGQYKNQKRVGEWKRYYKNGQISRLFGYNKGKLNEEEISYYKDGIVSNKTEKVGDDYINYGYYKSGKLRYERKKNSGYYKSFYESGALKIEANYLKNELVGLWKKHYENGQLEWLVNYEDGHREGVYKSFYDNGDLKTEGNNSRDKINGEEKRYLPNNILEWKGNYRKGVLNKTWTKYNASGKKTDKIKFKEGIASNSKFQEVLKPTKVANGVIERVPIYPGCEDFLNNTNRKKCMSLSVAKFINKNFNTDIASNINLLGKQRIFLFFKIDKTGTVTNAKAKAPHPLLSEEAIRVINLLPKVRPGTQRGKPVVIPFSIPIVFQVVE